MSRAATDWPLTPRRRENTGGSNTSTQRHQRQSSGIWAKQTHLKGNDSITYKVEWKVEDVLELAKHVEGIETSGDGDSPSEVLRAGRYTVDGMYKFDLGVSNDKEGTEEETTGTRRLTLFICCAALDVPGFTADLFVGIGRPIAQSGREYGSTDYLWSHSQSFTFRPNDDFVKIPLPVLSEIARDMNVQAANAFTLCIRIDEVYGTGPTFQMAGQVTVPTDLIAALGNIVDVKSGADVRFVCLEHKLDDDDETGGRRRISSASLSGSYTPDLISRKRVLYANSHILSARSSYFADLFKGDFAEGKSDPNDRYKTVVVESADFETVYWMLRFVYTNELLFDEEDDRVRDLLRRQSIDSTFIHDLTAAAPTFGSGLKVDEWGWHPSSHEDDVDTQSVSSSAHSSALLVPGATSVRSPTASSVAKSSSPKAIASRSSSGGSYPSNRTVVKGPHPTRPIPEGDPHRHPCEQPRSACALAIYMVAHQYRLDALEGLAKQHILSHLTHSTCIPVFLATFRYPNLHERVLEYIVSIPPRRSLLIIAAGAEHQHREWKAVKHDGEFVRCFQEVARGVWGEEGGTILADMVARLPY